MRKPPPEEFSLGAVVGAAVGAVTGLIAIGLPSAILFRDISQLIRTPLLDFLGWVVSVPGGWFLGGRFGPWLATWLGESAGNIVGGLIGGLLPSTLMAFWGWYLATH